MALRSYHAILYACLGGASSARSDEQPRAGVDLKRVQRERGPVQLWRPAPAHAAPRRLHCPNRGTWGMPRLAVDSCPSYAEFGSVTAGSTPDPCHKRRVASTLITYSNPFSVPGT